MSRTSSFFDLDPDGFAPVLQGGDTFIEQECDRMFAQRAGSRGTRELSGASHATSVSRPDEVAATIIDAVDAVAVVTDPVTARSELRDGSGFAAALMEGTQS